MTAGEKQSGRKNVAAFRSEIDLCVCVYVCLYFFVFLFVWICGVGGIVCSEV